MPSSRQILHDIKKYKLDPSLPHKVVSAQGRLRDLLEEKKEEVVVEVEEPVQKKSWLDAVSEEIAQESDKEIFAEMEKEGVFEPVLPEEDKSAVEMYDEVVEKEEVVEAVVEKKQVKDVVQHASKKLTKKTKKNV
jgi:hypothetical protein